MALQVWLPLNKDGAYQNQGLANISVDNNAVYYDSGKLGGCYFYRDGLCQSFNNNLTSIIGEKRSICVWVKPAGNHIHYTGAIVSSGNWNSSNWTFGVNSNNTGVTGFGSGYNTYLSCNVPVNEWTHLACVTNGTHHDIYKNGSYIGSLTSGDSLLYSDASNTTIGRETYARGYFEFNGYINDLRIYDHCLSPKEVKEISKGLVLHYPLNDAYVQSTTNLNKSIGINWDNWGTNTVTRNSFTSPEGTQGSHVNCSSFTSGGVYVSHSSFSVKPSTTYVISAKMKLTGYTHPNLFYWREYDSSNTKLSESGKWSSTRFIEYGHGYKLYYGTVTTSSTTISVSLQSYLYGVGEHWIYDIQVEEGTYPTPFAGYNASRTATTVYDCSGYQNNGTISGSLSCVANSSRYKISTVFDGISSKIINDSFPTSIVSGTNSFTICGWAYYIKGNSYNPLFHIGSAYRDATGICLHGEGNRIEGLDINGTKINNTYGSGYSNEKWVHQCIVYDGTTIKRYLNGNSTPVQSIACPGFKSDNNKLCVGGFWGVPFKGYLSDFRIYATALSAEDIKELYNTSAYVLDNGTLLTYSVEE